MATAARPTSGGSPARRGAYTYARAAGRYRDARGQFVPVARVRADLDAALFDVGRTMDRLTQQLQRGEISLARWELDMRQQVKQAQLWSGALAAGGFARMTPADYGRVGAAVRAQYRFLRGFAQDLASGRQPLDGRALARARMYAQAARATFHRLDGLAQQARGMSEERSVLHPAEHCDACVEEADRGWVPIGTIVPIGERTCRVNCRCTMEYRRGAAVAFADEPSASGASPPPVPEKLERLVYRFQYRLATPKDVQGYTREEVEIALAQPLPDEHLVLYRGDGTFVRYVTSRSRDKIDTTKTALLLVRPNGIATHNHPSGNTLSFLDVRAAIHGELAEVHAVTARGIFRLRRGASEYTDTVESVDDALAAAAVRQEELAREMRRDKTVSLPASIDRAHNILLAELGARYGFTITFDPWSAP